MAWHHIIPKHEWKRRFGNLTGFNAQDNQVNLSHENHTQLHRRYGEEGSKLDEIAGRCMSGMIGKEEARRLAAKCRDVSYMKTPEYREAVATAKRGKIPWNKGVPNSLEQNQQLSARMMGNKNCVGRVASKETREKHRRNMPKTLWKHRKKSK